MKVGQKKIADIVPYSKNAKKHDKKQIANVAESIKQYGFVQPVVIDKDGVIVIGHCRVEAAKKLGMAEVPCVCVDDLTEEQVAALRLVDNKSNESEWDMDLLGEELAELDLSAFDFDWGLKNETEQENPYTTVANIPQYQITGECPNFYEMYSTEKERELEAEIDESEVTEDEKAFLKAAAHRHCRFNYKKIAEYYANATPEMQRLMERSALVIIDVDNAIANGFAKLAKQIEEMADD